MTEFVVALAPDEMAEFYGADFYAAPAMEWPATGGFTDIPVEDENFVLERFSRF